MNSCEHYQELISRLVDGELSREEHEALMEHMKSCSACNAMYAVFHDLSDILAEEDEALPEGLHENIMAGVRRSEIMKKNRRMRRFGLSTALTAAACAVLVLFAAAGITPGKRAESVSIRTEEAAEQLMASPMPDAIPVQGTPAPVQSRAPADADTASGGMITQYSVPQQNDPYIFNNNTYQEQAAPAYTPAPAALQSTPMPVRTVEPAPAVIAPPVQAEEPAVFWSESTPAVYEAPAAPAVYEVPEAPAVYEAPAAPAVYEVPAPPAVQEPARTTEPAVNQAAPAPASEKPAEQESGGFAGLFSSFTSMFEAAPEDEAESKIEMQNASELPAPAAVQPAAEEAAAQEEPVQAADLPASGTASGTGSESGAAAQEDGKTVQEERVRVYGKAQCAQLLALLGDKEDALPEAELTRLVHVTFVPEDEYGSEEKMDIRIYGDFVFCERFQAGGGSKSYRADCSLKDLDGFLLVCSQVSPTPAPTVDPYIAVPEN